MNRKRSHINTVDVGSHCIYMFQSPSGEEVVDEKTLLARAVMSGLLPYCDIGYGLDYINKCTPHTTHLVMQRF